MKPATTIFSLLLLVSFSFYSCGDDEEVIGETPTYIKDEILFDCNHNVGVDGLFDGGQIEHILAYNNAMVFGGHINPNDYLLVTDGLDGEILLQEEMNVYKIAHYGQNVLICAEEGVFRLDENINLEKIIDGNCEDLETDFDRVLFTGTIQGNSLPGLIYEWYEATDTIVSYTTVRPENCVNIEDFKLKSEHEIWAMSCASKLIKYIDGAVVQTFDESNSPMFKNDAHEQNVFAFYGEEIIVVQKNGATYKIIKYTASGDWVVLKEFSNTISETEKDVEMYLPSLEDILIKGDKLYVGTTFAGCRGFQVFDISKDEPLADEDYYIIQDSSLPGQCISSIAEQPDGSIYVATLGGAVNEYLCN